MDFDRSFGAMSWGIVIDHTRPVVEVDISGGSASQTGGSASQTGGTSKVVGDGGPPKPFKRPRTDQPPEIPAAVVYGPGGSPASSERPPPIPNATYSVLDIPISTCKAVRVGCWASSPIDSDALKGKIYPNFLQTLKEKDSLRPPSGLTKLSSLQKFKDDCLRSPSEFPVFNLLQTLMKKHSLRAQSEFPDIRFSVPGSQPSDETRVTKFGAGPFPSAKVYKCIGRWNFKDRELKERLKSNEITFKSQYSYSTMEYRHCITTNHASCWKQESSGIMWAGVYGIDDICVVTLTGQDLDWKRVHGFLASFNTKFVLSSFRKCVLSELEDLADPTCKLSEEFDRSFDPPFCVVSAGTPVESGHETSSSVGHAPDVVSFVQGSGLLQQAKDSGGAIKLAISAFQRLMGKKFEATEIEVTVLFGRKFGNGYTRDLGISEIGYYLSAVEKSGTI